MTTSTVAEAPIQEPEKFDPSSIDLTIHDRCDQCQAQAYVQTFFKEGNSLLFCAHHFNKYAEKLMQSEDLIIVDQRDKLYETTKLDVSA